MIPEAKKIAVARGLGEAFGVSEFEGIQPLTAGLSTALVFRIVVRGRPYMLRVITQTDAISNPTSQFAAMQLAAEAGIAPRIWYANIDDRILITDFVEARPFPLLEALVRAPAALRTLHSLSPFLKSLNYHAFVDSFINKFRAAQILPESETQELFELYGHLQRIYPRNDANVPCHNDLKPENILFDGERVWLVDWEASFMNDRYFDLSMVANFVVTNEAEEKVLLETYFGDSPSEYQLARFFLMRQITHMSYAMVFLMIGSGGKPIDPARRGPDFRALHSGIWSGEVILVAADTRVDYGLAHMHQLLQNMRGSRFQHALGVVAAHHPGR